METIKRRLY